MISTMSAPIDVKSPAGERPADDEVRSLRDLSPQQWKSGIAAWLGWLFDGLDMHLYTLVATPVRRAVAAHRRHAGRARGVVQLAHPGGLPARLGARRRVLRADRRSPGAEPGAQPDDPDLCVLHGVLGVRADVVAPAHLPVRGRARHRGRVGRRRVAAVGDVAQALAALDRGDPADGGQPRRPAGRGHDLRARRPEPSPGVPGRRPPRAPGLLDPQGGPRARRVARRPRRGADPRGPACSTSSGATSAGSRS